MTDWNEKRDNHKLSKTWVRYACSQLHIYQEQKHYLIKELKQLRGELI
jgi:hypothetical protein